MKKYMLVVGLLFATAQTNCGFFDSAKEFLTKHAGSLYDKGKEYLSENAGTIFDKVKENAGPLYDKAKELLFGKAKEEAAKEETSIKAEAKRLVEEKTPDGKPKLTPAEQQAILKQAQELSNKNRMELEQQSIRLIEQKKDALRTQIREKYAL